VKFEFSAGAIIYRENSGKLLFLLLLKENDEYDIPKGHIEQGEDSNTAARREIEEETGLKVDFLPYFSTSTRYFFYKGREKVMKSVRIFISKVGEEKVRISYEHKGFEWLEYDEAYKKIKFKDMRKVLETVNDYIGRCRRMNELNEEYAELPGKQRRWDLSARFVPGEGPLNASMMFIGQAPGRSEDEKLRPFIGRSGELLSSMLNSARIRRDRVYITSVVQFFPPENRMPTDEESELCMPFLKEQVSIIKPKAVVLLGSLSSKMLLNVESVEKDHGRIVERNGIKYMVTFHPAAALRFFRIRTIMKEDFKKLRALAKPSHKRS
jgi:uracil-DNA glycosylase